MKFLLFFSVIFAAMVNFIYAANVDILMPPGEEFLTVHFDAISSNDGEDCGNPSQIQSPKTNYVPELTKTALVSAVSDANDEGYGVGLDYANKENRKVKVRKKVRGTVKEKRRLEPWMPVISTTLDVTDMNGKLLYVIDLKTEAGRKFIEEQHRNRKKYKKNIKNYNEEQEKQQT